LANITDSQHDTDLTDVKTPHFSSPIPVTASATVNATVTDSTTVDATAAVSDLMRFLIGSSQFSDVPILNMLPHVIAEGMAPNI